MADGDDSAHPDFWNSRYAARKTPWDFHGVPAALKAFLARSSPKGAVLIPGCGTGHEIRAFHEAGCDVSAIDFSRGALESARAALGPLAEKITLGDFFTHDFGPRRFDLVYERTFLCALHPDRWPAYAERIRRLLVPGGGWIGHFWYGRGSDPPPWPLTEEQAFELFGKAFRLRRSDPVPDSLPLFGGMERWQEWEKTGDV